MNKSRLALALCLSALIVSCGDDATGPEPCEGTCLVINNTSDLTVDDVRFSACSDSDWGNDRLVGNTIAAGESWEWEVDPGCYDIRSTASTGDGTCSISHFGSDIAAGERHEVEYDGCDVGPPVP
jgi:hypothetical protein